MKTLIGVTCVAVAAVIWAFPGGPEDFLIAAKEWIKSLKNKF